MNYEFKYKNTAFELFKLYFFFLYSSLAGIVNIIFTVAMIVLIYSKWNVATGLLRVVLVIAVLFFVLFQPVIMYNKARVNAKELKGEGKREYIDWKKIRAGKRFPQMLIIFTDNTNGYILTKRIVGDNYKKVFDDIIERIKR